MHEYFRKTHTVFTAFLLVLLAGGVMQAQTPAASVSGIVSDPSDAVVPNAKVTLTDNQRRVPFNVQTNGAGVYFIKDLIPSNYKVTVEAPGFRTYEVGSFPLTASQEAVLNISLQVGSASQKIEVTSQVQMVEPSNATLGGVVNNKEIADLPLATRNVLTLAVIQPGVQPANPNNYQSSFFTNAVEYAVNGGLYSSSEIQLDGVSILNQSDIPGMYGLSLLPSVESIQEFKVQTNDYAAGYGRSGGGITSMVTKSGTNSFHGSAFEFLQNTALDANNFFSNRSGGTVVPVHLDQYGGSIGGPVIKNKTFFFVDYERNLNHAASFGLFSVPTALERQGDFSQDYNAQGQLKQLYNPFSTRPDPANPGKSIRDPVPGNNLNNITGHPMDPVALKAITYYPNPNLPGTPISGTSLFRPVNNLGVAAVASSPQEQLNLRADHNFSSNKRGFVRYGYYNVAYGAPNFYNDPADTGYGTMSVMSHNAVLGYTQAFGSATVLDLRAMFNRFHALRPSMSLGYQLTTLGLPADVNTFQQRGAVAQFPGLFAQGYSALGNGGWAYYTSAAQNWIFQGTVSRVIGKQTLTMGAEQRDYTVNFFQPQPFQGYFSNDMTQGPNPLTISSAAGDGMASMLLGTGDNGGYLQYQISTANANQYYAEFVQDDIKVNRKLTVNLGLRLEEETSVTERFNREAAMDLAVTNPISQQVGMNVRGGYVFPGNCQDCLGRRALKPLEWKPNPRLGLAYSLNDKTVIRAGYGMFYGVPNDGAVSTEYYYTSAAFTPTTPWLATLDGITPNNLLSNPFPSGFVSPQGTSQGLLTGIGTTLYTAYVPSLHCPYNQQWNVSVQRSLATDMMLQVAYVGNKGTHLQEYYAAVDQLSNPAQYGTSLLTLVNNPFAGKIPAGGVLNQPQVQQGYLDLPYPGWTGVQIAQGAFANSEYNAMQVTLEKRYAHGTTFTAGYTWSKLMSDASDGHWDDYAQTLGSIRNYYNRRAEHSVSSQDYPNRFTLSGVGELPFGKGKRWGSGWHGVTSQVLGGWQANAILTLASGAPLELLNYINNSYSFGGGSTRTW